MVRLRFIAYFCTMLLSAATAQAQLLSDRAQVSLLTCGPGQDLYATFGHSALQIHDPVTGLDRVYNYGTFDFDTEGFYVKFTRGKLNYILSVTTFDQFIWEYEYTGRSVFRQVLDLSPAQKEDLFAFLEQNALPENREYKYDFFYDNCSTRIRDVLESVLGESLSYPEYHADTTATFRNLIDLYLTAMPWSDFGIDLALGLPCDKEADYREKMFLPDYLMAGMGGAVLSTDTGRRPLVKSSGAVLEQNPHMVLPEKRSVAWIFWVIFVVGLLAMILLPAPLLRWFDMVLFFSVGLLGIFLLFLWFGTDHTATNYNLNLLWALPTWLIAGYMIARGTLSTRFFRIHAFLMFLLILFTPLLGQDFHAAVIPLILLLTARSWAWQKYVRYLSLRQVN